MVCDVIVPRTGVLVGLLAGDIRGLVCAV